MTAIITDVHYRMAPALIRDLGRAGVKVVCCEREDVSAPLGFRSKYSARNVTLPAAGWLEDLYVLCEGLTRTERQRPALLPVGAVTLAALAAERERFGAVCGLCIPTPKQLDLLNSKAAVSALAGRLGVPVPRAFVRTEGEAVLDFAARLPLPCVVKPLCGEKLGLTAAQRYGIVKTPDEAAEKFERFRALAGEDPVVQEHLPGGGLGCSVLCEDGEVRAALCHQRVREYPVAGGPSACCDRADRPDLEAHAAAIVKEASFTGLAMFEFKEDAAGQARLLEVNPRIWGSFPLARVSGSGIPLLWFTLSWNQGNPESPLSPPSLPPFRPCRMRFAPSDLMSAAGYAKRGEVRRALGAVGDLFRPSVKDGLWEWSDPGPGLSYYASLLKRGRA